MTSTSRMRFEDSVHGNEAEAEMKVIKQKGHPAKEYVVDFQRLVGKLWY